MTTNDDQAEFWTTDAGRLWVAEQAALDALMQPVLDGVLARAKLAPGQTVLDIGCGTGASTLQAAALVGSTGNVIGADISPTMLQAAERRTAGTPHVQFVEADVAHHHFESMVFDQVISRFGVMFFAEPTAAFANFAKGMKSDTRITFAAWGQIPANPWFTLPAQAAKAQLGAPPPVDPDAPGPFAFRDTDKVRSILRDAGYRDIVVEVEDIALTPPGPPAEVAALATLIGPASRTLEHFGGDDADRAGISKRLEALLAQHTTDEGVKIPAEINFFQAVAPAR